MKKTIFTFLLVSITLISWGQVAKIKGTVKDEFGEFIPNVSVKYNKKGTSTDIYGIYSMEVLADKEILLEFVHLSHQKFIKKIAVKEGQIVTLDVVLQSKVESIDEIEIKSYRNEVEGITNIKVETIKNLPSMNASIESTIKVIGLGASSDNELSTQYKVRGGNYDENLVYVNEIEVYRPFLVRSGQQEGLSFVNVDMTQNVKFSSGGFQAKYGDKLSSVLDITYRKPTEFGLKASLSLLGVNTTVEGVTKDKNTSALLGLRYRNNSLLVNSKDVKSDYNPRFADIQSFITHRFNEKLSLDFLGTFSLNDYRYAPKSRKATFGTLADPKVIVVGYEGEESDKYHTFFGALKLNYRINDRWKYSLTTSLFNTQEEEYYDINAVYSIGEPNSDASADTYGESEYFEGAGSQQNHARNELDALIGNIQAKVAYQMGKSDFNIGVKYQQENIRDRLKEWELIDSAGYSIRPPGQNGNNQPYEPYTGPLVSYQNVRASNTTDIQRVTAFGQWNYKTKINEHQFWTSIGIRGHQWNLNDINQYTFSPRVQMALKPAWDRDVIFRISGGSYNQPPFYRELRNLNGQVQTRVKAQKSIHYVAGMDFSYKMWNRPFKLVTEAYYKQITDVNPYTLDNVRIRYAADNNAIAYAKGFDMRINGEFVPGTESWFSFSYLKTEENIAAQGYIARPSDQRLKFSLLFQDYVPSIPHLKMFMNLVFNTGVPGGSPTYSNPYDFQEVLRLGPYQRADIGIFYVFKDVQKQSQKKWLLPFKEFSLGGEIFNIFDMQNSITNTWVRQVYTKKMYGIKNPMTGRIFNVKLNMTL